MEISYFVILFMLVAAFVVFSFLAFRTSRRARIEGEGRAAEVEPRPQNLCYECLGAPNLDKQRLAECSAACGVMPE